MGSNKKSIMERHLVFTILLFSFIIGNISANELETLHWKIQVRPISSNTIVIQWYEPEGAQSSITGYKIYYTAYYQLPLDLWQSRVVGGGRLTTISGLDPHTIYTIMIQALISDQPGPLSSPVTVKTQLGVPSQPIDLRISDVETTSIKLQWNKPTYSKENIIGYDLQWNNKYSETIRAIPSINESYTLTGLHPNTLYYVSLAARSQRGKGPTTPPILVKTKAYVLSEAETNRDLEKAPMSANATTKSSVKGSAVDDLDEWQQISVKPEGGVAAKMRNYFGKISEKVNVTVKPEEEPLNLIASEVTTHSLKISWSLPISLKPKKYKIAFDATKEFVDSQGVTQRKNISSAEIILDSYVKSYTIDELSPFTTYNVTFTAIPSDLSYLPPTIITVTTQIAAPQPMVKPDFYGVVNGEQIEVILPQASEEYGPISHYYLVVVPEDKKTIQTNTSQLLTDDLIGNIKKHSKDSSLSYVAAKFPQSNIPYTFLLGTGEVNDVFVNYKLEHGKKYRIFVRAVVDTIEKELFTDSPFSVFFP